jgi:hypothetical protein
VRHLAYILAPPEIILRRTNKLFYRFWITPRRGETLSVSTRHMPSDVWALAGALTSYIGLHFLRFSDIFNREIILLVNFLTGFFCYLTFSMLDNMSYGRIVHLGKKGL